MLGSKGPGTARGLLTYPKTSRSYKSVPTNTEAKGERKGLVERGAVTQAQAAAMTDEAAIGAVIGDDDFSRPSWSRARTLTLTKLLLSAWKANQAKETRDKKVV